MSRAEGGWGIINCRRDYVDVFTESTAGIDSRSVVEERVTRSCGGRRSLLDRCLVCWARRRNYVDSKSEKRLSNSRLAQFREHVTWSWLLFGSVYATVLISLSKLSDKWGPYKRVF